MSIKSLKIEDLYPQLKNKKSLLAVSGGVDSIVLANLLLEASVDFSVAHCNFQLRGSESDDDFFFVEKWCQKHSIPFFSNIFSTKPTWSSIKRAPNWQLEN